MALTFVLGRAGAGKTQYCLSAIRRLMQEDPAGPPLLMLVPEQATHQTERALLTGPDAPSVAFRASVLSFRRLALRVLDLTGGTGRPVLDGVGRHMLLASLVERRRSQLKAFRDSARRPGFVGRLAGTVAECAAQRIGSDQLKAHAQALVAAGGTDELLVGKMHDVALLLADYHEAISDVHLDPHQALDLASDRLFASQALLGAQVWVDGFAGFTAQEYEMLGAIMSVAADVYIALCLDPAEVAGAGARVPGRDEPRLFAPTLKTYWQLKTVAAQRRVRLGAPVNLPAPGGPTRFSGQGALALLESHWARPDRPSAGVTPPAATGTIALVAAPDQRREVAAAAAGIVRLARERGYAWRDMAVVVPDLETYHDLLRVTFAGYGIPLFVDRRRPVPYHPLVELIRSAVEVAEGNWRVEAVFRWLKTDLGPLDRREVDLLENYVLARGVRGDRWLSEEPWRLGPPSGHADDDAHAEARPGTGGEPDGVEMVDAMRRKVAAVLGPTVRALREARSGPRRAGELVRALTGLLAAAGLPGKLERWAEEARLSGEYDSAQEHREVWDGVVRVLEQLYSALGSQPVRLAEFAAILGAGLESLNLGLVPPSLDQVVCGTIERSRQPELKAMFLLGACLGTMPGAPGEDLVFNDTERLALGERGLKLAAPACERVFHEEYLTYIALTRSSEYLWISYPQRSAGAATTGPSPAVARLKRLFPDLREAAVDDFDLAPSPAALASEAAARLAGIRQGIAPPLRWQQAFDWLLSDPARGEAARLRLAGLSWTNEARPLVREQALGLYGSPVRGSASRLEMYEKCPFAHFAAHGLRLAVRPRRQVKAPEIGVFYHAVLQRFFGELKREGVALSDLDDASLERRLDGLFAGIEETMAGGVWVDSGRLRHLAAVLQRTTRRTIGRLREHARRSAFTPLEMEVGFGLPGATWSALDLGEMKVRGIVDRIDSAAHRGRTMLCVMDYKSGRPQFKLSSVAHGISLQLPVYLLAVTEYASQLGLDDAAVVALLLYPVQDPMITLPRWDPQLLGKEAGKRWRPSGLVLNDPEVVTLLDRSAGDREAPPILPVTVNKAGNVSGTSAVSRDPMRMLARFVRAKAKAAGRRLLGGDESIRPWRQPGGGGRACEYCDFHAVCAFDPRLAGNAYRDLSGLKNEEAWARIAAAAGEEVGQA